MEQRSDDAVAAFYWQRGFVPLWFGPEGLRPEARILVAMLARARADGLDPARIGAGRLGGAAYRHQIVASTRRRNSRSPPR